MNHTPAQGTGTPRTDKAAFDINADGSAQYSPKGGYVGRDTCEALETELLEAKAELESVRLIDNETHRALTAALSSHAELRRLVERLLFALHHANPQDESLWHIRTNHLKHFSDTVTALAAALRP